MTSSSDNPTDHSGRQHDERVAGHLLFGPFAKLECLIIAYGAALRLTQYFGNRSLWLDESMLALNIVNRSFAQLWKPLDHDQGAPVGFLMLEKIAAQAFKNSEYGLRLFPLLFGLASIFLFLRVARLSLRPLAVPIALGLFATSAPLIYFSSEAKQYSSDVVVALLLSWAAIEFERSKHRLRNVAVLALAGAVCIWFSHPSVFVLAGIGAVLVLIRPEQERRARIGELVVVFLTWGLSLGVCYVVSLRQLSSNGNLLGYWRFSFPPAHPFSAFIGWFVSTFFGIFQYPAGIDLPGLAAFAFVVGCVVMLRTRRWPLAVFIFPILFTLAAAALHKYPFNGRLLLFAVPALLLLVGQGVEEVWSQTRPRAPWIGKSLVAVLFLQPILFSSYHLIKPSFREEIRPPLAYIEKHARSADELYVHTGSIPAFEYYAPRFDFSKLQVVSGTHSHSENNWKNYEQDLDALRGHRRVWLLLSLGADSAGLEEQRLFLFLADQRGKRIDSLETVGAGAYLYDMESP